MYPFYTAHILVPTLHMITLARLAEATEYTDCISAGARSFRRIPRGLFWTSVRSVALQKEQWQTWGL